MGGTRRRPGAAVTAAAVWLALPGLTSTQRTPQSVVQLNLDENGKEVPYILTPLHVRRERREWRPPKAHNEYVMFDHEKKQCDELPAIHPCFTYENEMGQDSFLVSSVDVGYHSTYDQNWQCGKTLLAPAGYTLQLDWIEFDLYLGDTVKVWDGCSNVKGERLLLTEATGAKNPTTVVSEMECLYIEFTTNERWQRGGFNASVTCNPPMYGGELGPAGPGYFEQECFQYWDNTGLARVDCMNFMHPGVQCHALRDIEHGVAVMSNERWYPSVAHYECEGGYEVCDGENNTAQNCVAGDNHRICMPSKIYNGTTPTCVGIICEEADKPEGARIRYRKASNGAPSVDPARQYPCFVEYACSPGYILNDDWDPAASTRRRCNEDGLWENLAPRCDAVPCPEFAGPPGRCVCANGYDGIPDWDDNNKVWLHECVRDHLDNVTRPDGSGSWEDPYTGTFCIENTDEHGHTCSQYVAAGYTCAMMISEYNYDCRCACE